MFDHVKFGVSDFAASKAFFLKAVPKLKFLRSTGAEAPLGLHFG
jgi:catechol 2,3-dioxygenase-like lactoylglutathione lyase family enzyme